MQKALGLIVVLFVVAATADAAEAPDKFRQQVRADPLINSIIVALRKKHGGCPWLDTPHGTGGISVMKEVDSYFYSEPGDYYRLQPARLDISLACFHAVSAEVHSYFIEEQGYQPLARMFQGVEFAYGSFIPYLSRFKPVTTTLDDAVLQDPLVKEMYPVISEHSKNCVDLDKGEIEANSEIEVHLGWKGKELEARQFVLSLACNQSSSGKSFRFIGSYFLESGFVAWEKVEVSGWVS